ncbi:MAG: hypothetical protein ACOCXX_00835 [Planctomycetota bacterium]
MHDLRQVYHDLEAELAEAGLSCRACGRCCNFAEVDFELWGSVLEVVWMRIAGVPIKQEEGMCPYRDDEGMCSNRRGRVLGCRVYFCTGEAGVVSGRYETHLGRIREVHRRRGLGWEYGPVLELLDAVDVRQICQRINSAFSA